MRLSARLSVRALVGVSVGALALAGGLLGGLIIEPIAGGAFVGQGWEHPSPPSSGLFVVMVTSFATFLMLGLALMMVLRRAEDVMARTVGACMLFGWLNAPLVLALVALSNGIGASLGGIAVGLFCGGVVVGAPLGLIYGVSTTFATQRLRRVLDRPTLASHTTAQRAAGFTVSVGALLGMVVAASGGAPLWWWTAPLLLVLGCALSAPARLIGPTCSHVRPVKLPRLG
ncbi:MAG: hypothetical protein AB8I08_08915 [Sandaracinaceae bacterium]